MFSQQKKVKWSRGETNSALEERTDTGITQVSVELLENITPDIYGNISRRKALKLVPVNQLAQAHTSPFIRWAPAGFGGLGRDSVKPFIFSISDGLFVIFNIMSGNSILYGVVIKDGQILKNISCSGAGSEVVLFNGDIHRINITQNNNFCVITMPGQYPIILSCTDTTSFTFEYRYLRWTSPWISPNGTETKRINAVDYTFGSMNWNNDGLGFTPYTYTDPNGITTVYDLIDTNVSNTVISQFQTIFPVGTIVQLPNIGCYFRIEGYAFIDRSGSTPDTWGAFGSLLTPAADEAKKDSIVKIITGYVRLNADPSSCAFSNQRLFMGGWVIAPGVVAGSQVGNFSDFKNDYNLDNEPSLIEIASTRQISVRRLIDYNGVKVFSDSEEYNISVKPDAAQLNSKNGINEDCPPILFRSYCLYCDASNKYIRSFSYEQNNTSGITQSNNISLLCRNGLIDHPVAMSFDFNSEGSFLYCLSRQDYSPTDLYKSKFFCAVSNFIPTNQVNSWGRYTFPKMYHPSIPAEKLGSVRGMIDFNGKTYFLTAMSGTSAGNNNYLFLGVCTLEDGNLDFEVQNGSLTKYILGQFYFNYDESNPENPVNITFPNNEQSLSIFNNNTGAFIKKVSVDFITQNFSSAITETANPRVGYAINAHLISHQVDVGGSTKVITKRIAKCLASIRNTPNGAFKINGKTGYFDLTRGIANFYNCTGNKKVVKYEIENVNGAKFTIESLTMNMEYGTLTS